MNLFNFIKANLPVFDVISQYTTLKKAGLYWKGHCPFHHEKTASFTVSPHKEIFYCFGCHIGGDVIAFMAKIENCTPIEAAKLLVERYQLTPPAELINEQTKPEEKKRYYLICKAIAAWCHNNLIKSPSIMAYLLQRGFTKETMSYFSIGYFPGGSLAIQNLRKTMEKLSILPHDLIEAGILSEGKSMLYSPFEERLIFPIKDHVGRHCGFGGRIFKPGDERPKYYNSRENEYFTKGSILFGFDLAKKSIQTTDKAFFVEGYTDCMAMVQHGFSNTVATLGTACTLEHLKQLSRYTQHLYIMYDGDNAGHQAVLRLAELCWHVSMELKVIMLPAGEDPASFLAKNSSLTPLVHQAQDIFVFFIESLGNNFYQQPLQEKVAKVRHLLELIQTIGDPLKQDILLQKASKVLEVPLETLQKELAKGTTAPKSNSSENTPPSIASLTQAQEATEPAKLEKKIFCAILNNTQLFNNRNEKYLLEYLPSPLRDILKRLQLIKGESVQAHFSQFFDALSEQEKQYVSKLLLETEEDIKPDAFEQLLMQLHKKNWKLIVQEVKTKVARAKSIGDVQKVTEILQDFNQLKQKLVQKNVLSRNTLYEKN